MYEILIFLLRFVPTNFNFILFSGSHRYWCWCLCRWGISSVSPIYPFENERHAILWKLRRFLLRIIFSATFHEIEMAFSNSHSLRCI